MRGTDTHTQTRGFVKDKLFTAVFDLENNNYINTTQNAAYDISTACSLPTHTQINKVDNWMFTLKNPLTKFHPLVGWRDSVIAGFPQSLRESKAEPECSTGIFSTKILKYTKDNNKNFVKENFHKHHCEIMCKIVCFEITWFPHSLQD